MSRILSFLFCIRITYSTLEYLDQTVHSTFLLTAFVTSSKNSWREEIFAILLLFSWYFLSDLFKVKNSLRASIQWAWSESAYQKSRTWSLQDVKMENLTTIKLIRYYYDETILQDVGKCRFYPAVSCVNKVYSETRLHDHEYLERKFYAATFRQKYRTNSWAIDNWNYSQISISTHEIQRPIFELHRIFSSKLNKSLGEFIRNLCKSNAAFYFQTHWLLK